MPQIPMEFLKNSFILKATRATHEACDQPSFTQILSDVVEEKGGAVQILDIEE